jgi:mucin-19
MATLKNTTINDTGFLSLPPGTTAQRPASPVVGMIRYNTDLGFSEQYTSDGWQGIAPPPVITSISPTSFNGEGGTTITVNGANFDSTATIQFILSTGSVVNAATTTRVSSSQLTCTTSRDFLASESPADIKVVNGSGLSAVTENALTFADVPVFTTASGSLGTIFDVMRTAGYSLSSAAATDAGGGSISSYAITTGAVPSGMSFNTSTAAITGTPNAVGSDTTSTFTIRATDNAGNTTDRSFSITVRAPVVTSYTSTGSTTFSVPSGVTFVRALVVAGGGGGSYNNAGGAGAGGMIDHPAFPVSPGGSIPVTVGAGGSGTGGPDVGAAPSGGNSVFGSLTAIGGAGSDSWTSFRTASSGGSGAGGSGNPGYRAAAGTGTQPSQPGASGTFGFGNPGGIGGQGGGDTGGGGGGGAGGAGVNNEGYPGSPAGYGVNWPTAYAPGGHGGLAKISNVTGSNVYYAGGGGAGSGGGPGSGPFWPGDTLGGIGGIGGPYSNPYGSSPLGGAGNGGSGARGTNGNSAGTNTGSGGGGGDNTPGGNGGPGIVIIRY